MTDSQLPQHHITVRPAVSAADVQSQIEAAFRRNAEIDARRVTVSVQGRKVTLTGYVRSWAEREQAEHAAWTAPGVGEESQLAVAP